MTLFMFFKRSSLQAHEDSSETPLTPQKRMRSETRPSIGTPSFILIAIPFFFSPPVSSYFFSNPPTLSEWKEKQPRADRKTIAFQIEVPAEDVQFLNLTSVFLHTPHKHTKKRNRKKKIRLFKKKNKRERLRERKERDGPF